MKKDKKQIAEELAAEETVEETVDAVEGTADDEVIEAEETAKESKKEKKVRSADMIRRLRHGRTAKIITVGVVALTILLNVVFSILGNRFPLTLDLTANKQFSLTDESKAIATSLTRPVEIVVFASEETFSDVQSDDSYMVHGGVTQLANVLSEFYNATKQYNSLTNGKVTTTYIDMNSNPTIVSEYSQYKEDEAIAQGDILFISDKQSKASSITNLASISITDYTNGAYGYDSIVEQTLATNLKAVQSENPQVITFATGYNEDSNTLTGLQNLYSLNGYDIEEVNMARSPEINPNTVCLVIPAPSTDYSDDAIEMLRDWLDNDGKEGRNLMVFVDPSADVDCPNLYEYLKTDFDLEVTDKLVYENDYNLVLQYDNYSAYATIAESDYTLSCAGGEVYAGQTRQIIPHLEPQDDSSTEYSVDLLTFSETAQIVTANDSEAEPEDYSDTIVGMAISVLDGYQNATQEAVSTKVVVCGSAEIAYDAHILTATNKNEDLLLDSMSKLTGSTNTVNISSKSMTEETISFSVTAQIFVGFGLFTVALPVALLIIGLVVFLRRRHL